MSAIATSRPLVERFVPDEGAGRWAIQAALVLAVAVRMALSLTVAPQDTYSMEPPL